MPKDYVKQHIVPKRYLDRFTFEKNGKPVIGVRMEKNGKVSFFTSPTDKVGYIKNIYDVDDKDNPKYWEHYFANEFDSLCGTYFDNFISKATLSRNQSRIITEADKNLLSKFLVGQILRNPQNFDYAFNRYPEFVKDYKAQLLQRVPKKARGKVSNAINNYRMSKREIIELYLNKFFGEEGLKVPREILKSRIWVVYDNCIANKMPFATSDNPVIVLDHNNNSRGIYNVGFANKTASYFFPMSKRIAIAIYSNLDSNTIGSIDGKLYRTDETEFIGNMNMRITEQAYRHTFIPQPYFDRLYKKGN